MWVVYIINALLALFPSFVRKDIRSSFEIDVEVYSLVRQNIWHIDLQSILLLIEIMLGEIKSIEW